MPTAPMSRVRRNAWRCHRQLPVLRPAPIVAKQYTILNAAGGLSGSTFNALVNTNLPANFTVQPEL